MASGEAERFLHEAVLCRDLAERSHAPGTRKEWALLAEGYVRLAEAARCIEKSAILTRGIAPRPGIAEEGDAIAGR